MTAEHLKPFERFRGKRGLVMGLGVFGGGIESAKFLSRYCSHVLVTDLRDESVLKESIDALEGLRIEYRLGEHRKQDFEQADVVIHSPAVRPDNPLLQAARHHGAEVTMEMSLFIEACPAKTVGITGSNGKTTTALLAYEMLCEVMQRAQPELEGRWAEPAGEPPRGNGKVWLGGNCGEPLLNKLEGMTSDDVVVLELSSFQLQDWHRIKKSSDISVITNITPNHLDWHKDMAEYIWAKAAIYVYSTGSVICNSERDELAQLPRPNGVEFRGYSTHDAVAPRETLRLPGQFNWSNACAAMVACKAICDADLVNGLKRFRGVEHRLEFCGEVNGARCFNDSIATTPESTIAGLSAFDSGVHLLLGGSDKGLSYDALAKIIAEHCGIKGVYLQGANADAIEAAILRTGMAAPLTRFATFDAACDAAFAALEPGDVFLMSPASASFYEYAPHKRFTNFEHRGRYFKTLVQAHASKTT
ncbi:MAG: hypothetical protein KDB90_04200 [Planctomycetes bacterium]|nr:hypothetical protein [Planctomycetota bacterium]